MLTFYNNKINIEKVIINYRKLKIKEFVKNNKFIIFCDLIDDLDLKHKLLNYGILSFTLKKKYIKALFNLPHFSFLEGESFFCIFINNIQNFIAIVNNLENREFLYSYKNSLSNYTSSNNLLEVFNKYNKNYDIFHFLFIKKKLKIIILLYLFSISLIKFIKIK